ncbi:MAG: polysaccharide deacetylase family protein [Lentisphaeria bacterium]|nr:polysaccharide deacetylase family protein [Lentisphaeria bacterium]
MKRFLMLLASMFCSSSSASEGTLCLTFDDRYFENWEKMIPLFKKYDARVTFFVFQQLDDKSIASMKALQSAGHTIGLHGQNHLRASDYLQQHGPMTYLKNEIMPQLEICRKNGIKIRAFAYPFSQRSSETDKELFTVFDFLRTNCTDVKKKEMKLAEADGCFVKKVGRKQLFYGFPASGNFNMEEVKTAIKRAAEDNAVLVFYAHDITENQVPSHHISISQLEELLKYAKSLKISICGLNEL